MSKYLRRSSMWDFLLHTFDAISFHQIKIIATKKHPTLMITNAHYFLRVNGYLGPYTWESVIGNSSGQL